MKIILLLFLMVFTSFIFAQNVPVAAIGDMELMKIIHKQTKAYCIKKNINNEEVVYVSITLDENGFQKARTVIKSSSSKLNKIALKFVKSYKLGWIIPSSLKEEERSIVIPVIFSTKIDVDNL